MERSLLVAIAFAFFGAGLVTLATCSRMVFAMSRDARFPAHQLMRRVNPRTQTPIPATILPVVVGVVLMAALPGDALLELLTVGGLIGAVLYGAIIVLYLAVRKAAGAPGGRVRSRALRDAGRDRRAGVVGRRGVRARVALRGLDRCLDCRSASLLGGGVYFAYLLIFHREVLETEPGEIDAFKH